MKRGNECGVDGSDGCDGYGTDEGTDDGTDDDELRIELSFENLSIFLKRNF